MRALPALALLPLALLALAGCLASPEPAQPAALPALPALVAHGAAGLLPLPPAWEGLAVRLAPTGFQRGEPTLGVAGDGTLFTVAGSALASAGPAGPSNTFPMVARSRDHGATWEPLLSPFAGKVDVDPWVWVDPATDRVFHAPLWLACSWLAWSDDLGEAWEANPLGGCGLPVHDHQKLTTGPPPAGVPTQGYPSIVYYAYNSLRGDGSVVSRSLDGGRTWSAGAPAHPSDGCYGGTGGSVAVDAAGVAYHAKPTCDGVRVAASEDGGATWALRGAVEGVSPHSSINPEVVPDGAGTLYLLWNAEDNLQRLAVSGDGGRTWGPAHVVPPPAVRATLFGVMVAGAPGRVAIGYIGTGADPAAWEGREPSYAPDDTTWHLYLTFADDARAAEPVFVTLRATPEDDPVQRGCVWLQGGVHPCRNLRDFIDLVSRDGRAYLAYADGCRRCADAAGSRALGETTLAIVERGPSLLGGHLPPLGTAPDAAPGRPPPQGAAPPALR